MSRAWLQPQLQLPQEKWHYSIAKEKIQVFRLPNDKEECVAWIKAIPFKKVKFSMEEVICKNHSPAAYSTVNLRASFGPRIHNRFGLMFHQVVCPDLLLNRILLNYPLMSCEVGNLTRCHHLNRKTRIPTVTSSTVSFQKNSFFAVLQLSMRLNLSYVFNRPIWQKESLNLYSSSKTLHFKAFHMGIKVKISPIVKNRMQIFNFLLALEEIIHFWNYNEEYHKVTIFFFISKFNLCQLVEVGTDSIPLKS